MSDVDDLAELLHEKTSDGKLKWQLPTGNRVTTKQGNNTIDVIRNHQGQFEFSVRNINGVILLNQTYNPSTTMGLTLRKLFDKARRDSLGIDEAISDIKQRLLHL